MSGLANFFSDHTTLTIILATLLPLAPALLLFRFLPSGTVVEGPFKNLKIKLVGASAGYFILVIAILFYSYYLRLETNNQQTLWTVRGHVVFSDDNGLAHQIRIYIVPPNFFVLPNGSFEMNVPTRPPRTEKTELPTMILEHNGYRPAVIDLNQQGSRNEQQKTISLQHPVTLEVVPTDR